MLGFAAAVGGIGIHASTLDYAILGIYFLVVLGIGLVARLTIKTDLDFFLSGRSLPAWITGLAFVAANLGALEILQSLHECVSIFAHMPLLSRLIQPRAIGNGHFSNDPCVLV